MEISETRIVKISWGALIVASGILIAFSAWMTSVDNKAAAAQEMIVSLKEENTNSNEVLYNIDKRLQRIEILLEQTIKNINKEK